MSEFDDLLGYVMDQGGGDQGQEKPLGPFAAMSKAGGSIMDIAFGRDPAFSQEGIPKFGFRAGLSAADTPEERASYLNRTVGQGGWTTDKYGAYALTPSGKQALGLDPGDKPTLIDAPLTAKGIELGDIADIRGDIPAIAGGIAGATAATGAGVPIGIAAAAGGAGLGKLIDEMTESAMGQQMQTPGQVATDVAKEMALAGGGEVIYRGALAPLGRKIMAPHASRITPEASQMAEDAAALGVPLKPTTITRAPLLSTAERIASNVLQKDPVLDSGRRAIKTEVNRLTARFGRGNVSKEALGELVTSDIRSSRNALSRMATKWYGKVDELAEGRPIVSTARLKEAAQDIVEDFPKGADGRPLFTEGEGMRGVFSALRDIDAMPDAVTVRDMYSAEKVLRDLGDIYGMAPGSGSHYSSLLTKAIDGAYDDAIKQGEGAAVEALKTARRNYAKEISKFTNGTVRRIVRDPKMIGAMTPTQIADLAASGADPAKIGRIKSVVSPETWAQVQRLSMENILQNITRRTKDPLEDVLSGEGLLNALDKFGKPALEKMFGKQISKNLYQLGNAARAVEWKTGNAGQLISASIAAAPIANVGRILNLMGLSKLLSSKFGAKYFTTGLKAPRTRVGTAAISRAITDLQLMADSDVPRSPVGPSDLRMTVPPMQDATEVGL